MAQTMICDNHQDDPREAVLLLTQVGSGEVAKFCAHCWPVAFAQMIDALPPDERPGVAVPTATPPADDDDGAKATPDAGDGDKVVEMRAPRGRQRSRAGNA